MAFRYIKIVCILPKKHELATTFTYGRFIILESNNNEKLIDFKNSISVVYAMIVYV